MVAFSGRIEARLRVPSGGASVSAATGAMLSPVTVTIPAGDYFFTSAGGVTSILDYLSAILSENAQGYPMSAVAMNAVVGYGTWSAGWLCNESSGNLAPSFGSPTLSALSTPTYGTAGPRLGIDKAVGFNSANDRFNGGNVFDVDANDDLVIAWVAKHSTLTGNGEIAGKGWGGGLPAYMLAREGSEISFNVRDATPDSVRVAVTVPVDTWYVGIAVLDRTTNKARVGICTTAGVVSISSESSTTAVGTLSNAFDFVMGDIGAYGSDTGAVVSALYVAEDGACATGLSANLSTALARFASAITSGWTCSLSTTDGRVTITHSFWGYSLDWTSTDLRDLLGFTSNLSGLLSQTGTEQARGLWFPDSPLNLDDHPSMAPDETDLRASEGPTGVICGLSGNVKYVHTNLAYQRVPVSQIREAEATYANGSLEVFFRDAISGIGGHEWMGPATPLQVYWSNQGTDALVGADANDGAGTAGWVPVGIRKFSDIARPSQRGWVGAFDVVFPRLVSSSEA